MQQHSSNSRVGTGSGLVAILLWSATFAVARSLSEQVGPLTAGASVYLIAGLFCLVRVGWLRIPIGRFLRLSRRYLFGCGFLFVLYTALIYLAVGLARDREQVLEIALINYLWPASTILFSLFLLEKRASWLLLPGTVLAYAGIVFVLTQGAGVSWGSFYAHLQINPLAYLLALAAALAWALYSNLTRRWSEPGRSGAVELFIVATGLVLLGMRLCWPEPTGWSARAVAEAGLLGAITALAYALWEVAMRTGHLLLVVVCSYFTPLLSTLVSCAYLGLAPGPKLWTGCLLLMAGSFLSWLSVRDRSASTRPAQSTP